MEDPHTFVGFTNIAGVEIEYYDGDSAKILTEDELRAMLESQYVDKADQLDSLVPATLIDRGIRREEYKSTERIKTKSRYRKIAIVICIVFAYFAWSNGL